MRKYYLFEKNAHGGLDYKQYTLQDLNNYFDTDFSDIEDLKDYIENNINNCDGCHYHDYYIEYCD